MSLPTSKQITTFRKKILDFYRRNGRDLPFRRTTDPYAIAVAEFMLQQTQVERVVPKWEAWLTRWPDWVSLAGAGTREVLAAWSGLGYNRRAIYLLRLARTVVRDYDGILPDDEATLRRLPGIGPYTAAAILIFAFNAPIVAIDANIRRVLVHEFKLRGEESKKDLRRLAERLLPRERSRDWHNALMDYSRMRLPRTIPDARAPRQSRFQGSRRQIRGHIIKRLTTRTFTTTTAVARELGCAEDAVSRAAGDLEREGLVRLQGSRIRLQASDSE